MYYIGQAVYSLEDEKPCILLEKLEDDEVIVHFGSTKKKIKEYDIIELYTDQHPIETHKRIMYHGDYCTYSMFNVDSLSIDGIKKYVQSLVEMLKQNKIKIKIVVK